MEGVYTDEFWDWVKQHQDDDPARLRLKERGKESWKEDAIAQIENVKESKKKFSSSNIASDILPRLMPLSMSVEQATSANVALLHKHLAEKLLPYNKTILDMTCGLGVDTALLSTIPKSHVTSIEKNSRIAEIAIFNFKDKKNIKIINADSVEFLQKTGLHYNLIYIDPARRDNIGNRVYNIRDCSPNVIEILPLLKEKCDAVMIKLSPMLDVTQTLRELDGISDLYIIEDGGECRELLAILNFKNTANPQIHVWNSVEKFKFQRSEELNATELLSLPQTGLYLIEPSPAMMKAGPFKLISSRYDIPALHPNTHLYISQQPIEGFPGRQDLITEILPFSSGNLKRLKKLHLQADVAVRNFPYTADDLRTRLGIKKSGNERIVGVTACDGNQYLLRLKK